MNESSSGVDTTAAAAAAVAAGGVISSASTTSVTASALGAAAGSRAAAGATGGGIAAGGHGGATAAAAAAAAAAAQHAQSGEGAGVDLGRRVPAFPDPSSAEVQMQRLSTLFFGGEARPTDKDPDFPRMATPREQRHTELSDAAVKAAVMKVVLPLRQRIQLPNKDGSLKAPREGDLSRACVKLEESSVRARRCKGPEEEWTAASKALARAHHLVTGTVIFLVPEVFDRQALLQTKEFQVIKGGKVVGVRLPCRTCGSNDHTAWDSWSHVRPIHGTSGENSFLVSSRRACLNPHCDAVKANAIAAMKTRDAGGKAMVDGKKNGPDIVDSAPDAVKEALRRGDLANYPAATATLLNGGVSFTVSDSSYMEMLPLIVQAKYDFVCFGKGAAQRALLDLTVTGSAPVAVLQRQVMETYHFKQRHRHTCWSAFAEMNKGGGLFPELGVVGTGTLLSGPSKMYMETYCSQAFKKVKPLFKRAMCNLSPGKSISLDATFRIAKMSIGHATCIVFILGEYGHIIHWAALRSDKWSNILPVLYALRKRLDRLGTLNDVEKVFADTCCEGMAEAKVSEHVVVSIFPNVTRAPFADLFHKTQIISSHSLSSHPLHAAMTREVGNCIAQKHEPDIHRVAASIIVTRGMTAEKAMEAAFTKHYRKHIRTFTPDVVTQKLKGVRQKFQKLSDEGEARGERALFQNTLGASQSTVSSFDNVIACGEKGCFSDRSVQDAYVCDKIGEKTKLPHWKKLEGTGANEATHSKANGRVAVIASRMGDNRTERELWLFIHEHNRSMDENRGIAKPDFLRNFWEEEKLSLLAGNVEGPVPGGNLMVPPELRDEDMETMGFECLSMDQDQVALDIARQHQMDFEHLQASSLPAVAGAELMTGLDDLEYGLPGQAEPEPVERRDPSFGRHGGRGRERVAGEAGGVGSGGSGSGRREGGERARSLESRTGSSLGKRPAAAAAPAPPRRPPPPPAAAAAAQPPPPPPPQTAPDPRRAGAAMGGGLGEQDSPPAGTRAAESHPGLRAAGAIRAGAETGGSTSTSRPAGPKDGRGRLAKHRNPMLMTEKYASPTTDDEEKLARQSFAGAKAQGLRGDDVWEAAAKLYNCGLTDIVQKMRDTGRCANSDLTYQPIDRALFKRFWGELSQGTVLQRAGANAALLPQMEGVGGGGVEGGAAPPPTVLQLDDIMEWSGNKLRKECRRRSVGVANTTKPAECVQRLINAGWVKMPAVAV